MEGCVTKQYQQYPVGHQIRMALDCRVRGTCPCCGDELVPLVKHHWTELDGTQHEKLICNGCNSLLRPILFGHFGPEWNHILPSWDEQVRAVREKHESSRTRCYLLMHPEVVAYYTTGRKPIMDLGLF